MKNNFRLYLVMCLVAVALNLDSCIELGGLDGLFSLTVPEGYTLPATEITDSSATLNGLVRGGYAEQKVWFVYYNGDLTGEQLIIEANPPQVIGDSRTIVSAKIKGLKSGTTILYKVAYNFNNPSPKPTPMYGGIVAFATNYQPDQLFEGGLKFYTDSTGQHGLIASTNDQSYGIQWSPLYNKITNATLSEIGTGRKNTGTIVSSLGKGDYAARLCDDLILNGYSDWFLPSKDELNMMYMQRNLIGGLNPQASYWSSTESDSLNVWIQSFVCQRQYFCSRKSDLYKVRAIRAY
jgi:hypothetical protein